MRRHIKRGGRDLPFICPCPLARPRLVVIHCMRSRPGEWGSSLQAHACSRVIILVTWIMGTHSPHLQPLALQVFQKSTTSAPIIRAPLRQEKIRWENTQLFPTDAPDVLDRPRGGGRRPIRSVNPAIFPNRLNGTGTGKETSAVHWRIRNSAIIYYTQHTKW